MSQKQPHTPHADRFDDFDVLTLPDGRDLAFMEWGDSNGFPVFYFHGTPSSRLEGAFAHEAAQKHEIRLIATDRPGFGRSGFQRKRRFGDWPDDVCALADHLNIAEFGVAGHSGAGPHLFACGSGIPPDRLKFIGALGPWGPTVTPEIIAEMNRLDRFFLNASNSLPWLMQTLFAPIGWCAKYWPRLFFRLMQSSVSTADKAALQNDELRKNLHAAQLEAFQQGSKGGSHEAFIAFQPWDIDIAQIAVPTYIWLGDEDIFVSKSMGHYLEHTIPGVGLNWAPGKGHFNIENWDDIFAACTRHIKD